MEHGRRSLMCGKGRGSRVQSREDVMSRKCQSVECMLVVIHVWLQ